MEISASGYFLTKIMREEFIRTQAMEYAGNLDREVEMILEPENEPNDLITQNTVILTIICC